MHSCWSKRSEACSYKRSEIRSEKRSYKNYLKGAVPYTHYETPSFKTLPAKNWNFRHRRRKDISKKLLEKLPCFDRGAGEATAETEGFIHTKRKPPLTPAGSSPKGRGAFQLLSDHILWYTPTIPIFTGRKQYRYLSIRYLSEEGWYFYLRTPSYQFSIRLA